MYLQQVYVETKLTVCPRSLDPFDKVSHYVQEVLTHFYSKLLYKMGQDYLKI